MKEFDMKIKVESPPEATPLLKQMSELAKKTEPGSRN